MLGRAKGALTNEQSILWQARGGFVAGILVRVFCH